MEYELLSKELARSKIKYWVRKICLALSRKRGGVVRMNREESSL